MIEREFPNFPGIELGKNEPSFRFQQRQFLEWFLPIIEAARSNPQLNDKILATLDGSIRKETRFTAARLAKQKKLSRGRERGLNSIEKAFLASAEMRTAFNPDLVALTRADKQLMFINMIRAAELKTRRTLESFPDGAYIPDMVVGAGPAGENVLSVLSWLAPDLAETAVVVDSAERAGGPFAVPNGPAWKLNSGIQSRDVLMPDEPQNIRYSETIRAYGAVADSFNVSERTQVAGEDGDEISIRTRGSINRFTIDGLTPDHVASSDFANSFDMDLAANINNTMNNRWSLFNSEVVSVNKSGRNKGQGQYQVVMDVPNYESGQLERRVYYVDRLYLPTGLGRDRNGFETDPSKQAFQVLQESKKQKTGVRKYSTTLTFMRELVNGLDPEAGKGLGRRIGIAGAGDSFKIVAEILLGIFDSTQINSVEKIYVFSSQFKLAVDYLKTERPRYLALVDKIQRADREGKIEYIDGRVSDIAFNKPTDTTDVDDQTLSVFDQNGRRFRNSKGQAIEIDNFISTAGFEDRLPDLLRDVAETRDRKISYKNITLPTNRSVIVAKQVIGTNGLPEDIITLGTASDPEYDPKTPEGRAKLNQLPAETQKTLATLPAENLVALAVRMQDVVAGTREFLRVSGLINPDGSLSPKRKWDVGNIPQFRNRTIAQNPDKKPRFLTTIDDGVPRVLVKENVAFTETALQSFCAQLLGSYEFTDDYGTQLNGELEFSFIKPKNGGDRQIQITTGAEAVYYQDLLAALLSSDPFIAAHIDQIFKLKNSANKIMVKFPVKDGLIQPRKAMIETTSEVQKLPSFMVPRRKENSNDPQRVYKVDLREDLSTIRVGQSEQEVAETVEDRAERLRRYDVYRFDLTAENFSPLLVNEIGVLVLSAATEGRAVVINIDPNLRDSLKDNPYYVAQFEGLLVSLRSLTPLLRDRLRIIEENEEDPGEVINSIDVTKLKSLEQLRAENTRGQIPDLTVLTGSGAPRSSRLRSTFEAERKSVVEALGTQSIDGVANLVSGTQAQAWDEAYETNDAKQFKSLALSELNLKLNASKLVITIHDESTTYFGTSEIAPLMTNAILTGQSMRIMLESLNRGKYLAARLGDALEEINEQMAADPSIPTDEYVLRWFKMMKMDNVSPDKLSKDPNTKLVIDTLRAGKELDWELVANSVFADSSFAREAEAVYAQREETRLWVQQTLQILEQQKIDVDIQIFDNINELNQSLERDNRAAAQKRSRQNQTFGSSFAESRVFTEAEGNDFLSGTPDEVLAELRDLLVRSGLDRSGYTLKYELSSNEDRRTSFREILQDQKLYRIFIESAPDPTTRRRQKIYLAELIGSELANKKVKVTASTSAIQASLRSELAIFQLEQRRIAELQAQLQREADRTRQENLRRQIEEERRRVERENNARTQVTSSGG